MKSTPFCGDVYFFLPPPEVPDLPPDFVVERPPPLETLLPPHPPCFEGPRVGVFLFAIGSHLLRFEMNDLTTTMIVINTLSLPPSFYQWFLSLKT